MRRIIIAGALGIAGLSCCLWAQQPAAAQPAAAQPAAKQPKIKSQAELKAVQAIQAAVNDPEAVIKASEELVTKFADSDYKEFALTMEANAYHMQQKDDDAQVVAERVLEINPHSYMIENLVGNIVSLRIKDHDLNRTDEIAKATKMFMGAIADANAATKPNPQLTDEQWAQAQKYAIAESHNGLGILAQQDKHWDLAAKEYQTALEGDPEQDAYAARLANAYLASGKKAESIATCDKLLAKPNLNPIIKNMVSQIKNQASR